jgi:sugar lactone lactonase YvrE
VKRRQKRKIALLAALTLALVLVGLWFWNFSVTKRLTVDLRVQPSGTVTLPNYLYSFAGDGANRLQSPVGIAAYEGNVYVADSVAALVFEFTQDGAFVRSFGKGQLRDPLYVAANPKDGLLYVSDRRARAVVKFKTDGTYVGVFDPKLPASVMPPFDTKGEQWIPVGLTFAPDGSMYVLDVLGEHRMLIFGPDGVFRRTVGKTGIVSSLTDLPGSFQFPNSVKVRGDEVWVVDSNNRRIQVFSLAGDFKRIVAVNGLPRGMAFVSPPARSASGTLDAFAVVDTLSHDVSIWTVGGTVPVVFGGRGVLDGQFNFPNDITVGDRTIMFVTDNKNVRVQAWGWDAAVSPLPLVLPRQPLWYLALLPLLLIPLFRRKKNYFATADFIEAMATAGALDTMPAKNRRWLVLETDYEALRDRVEGGVPLATLLTPTDFSPSDARAWEQRLLIDTERAAALATAKRSKLFGTEDPELKRLATFLEIEVVDAKEFIERSARKKGGGAQ